MVVVAPQAAATNGSFTSHKVPEDTYDSDDDDSDYEPSDDDDDDDDDDQLEGLLEEELALMDTPRRFFWLSAAAIVTVAAACLFLGRGDAGTYAVAPRDCDATTGICTTMTINLADLKVVARDCDTATGQCTTRTIPSRTAVGPFGRYPNFLNISESDRQQFHPVVKFPLVKVKDKNNKTIKVAKYKIMDFTKPTGKRELATEEERQAAATTKKRPHHEKHEFVVGRYDEKRVDLYESDLFLDDTTTTANSERRNIHMGMDLGGPLGTPVHAFSPGTVFAAGYNPALGDYGYVIVVKHELPPTEKDNERGRPRIIYALYGHLSAKSVKGKRPGQQQRVRKGQVLGWMGDVHENGGWLTPHVHFQLSLHPPEQHDMPGVVSKKDRDKALIEYPDPRYVLGQLY